MDVLISFGHYINVYLICVIVIGIEAAVIDYQQGRYSYDNEIAPDEKLQTSVLRTTTTTITITEPIKESLRESISAIESSLQTSVYFSSNEEKSLNASHTEYHEEKLSPTLSMVTNSSNTNFSSPNNFTVPTPTVINNQPTNSSLVTKSSISISAVSAIPFTSIYQPVIHLEKEIQREFFHYLSILENPFLQRLAKKILQAKIPFEDIKIGSFVSEDYLSQKQLRSIFKLSKHAFPSLLRCRQPEATITVKCISNIARVTFLSDSETRFNAEAVIYRKQNGTIKLEGYKHNAYLVWWTELNETKSELSYKLTKDKLERKCVSCNHLEAVLKLEGDKHACLIPVNCKQPQNEIITFNTSKLKMKYYNIRNVPVITTSMAIHNLDDKYGNLITDEISSGNDVNVLIQATSDTNPVGVFVKECKITARRMKPVAILANGCSISNFLENFRVVPTTNEKNNKYGTTAKFIPFQMQVPSQNLTLGCSIMVCDGICDVHSACQNFKSLSSALHSRRITEIYLEASYRILPQNLPKEGSLIDEIKVQQPVQEVEKIVKITVEKVDSKTSQGVVYTYVVLICLLFTGLLSATIFYFQHQKSTWKKSKLEEEIESPSRTIYPYESNPRRRSPNSSSVLDFGY